MAGKMANKKAGKMASKMVSKWKGKWGGWSWKLTRRAVARMAAAKRVGA